MAITTQPHYFHNGFPALSSPPPRPPSSTPLSYHLLKCINSSEINSLLYDAVSANVMIFVQKMGESESGFSFAFGSQPFEEAVVQKNTGLWSLNNIGTKTK